MLLTMLLTTAGYCADTACMHRTHHAPTLLHSHQPFELLDLW